MPGRLATARSMGIEVASHPLGDDGDQAQLQVGSPTERPEEEVPGTFDGKRNGIDGRDGAHIETSPKYESVPQTTRILSAKFHSRMRRGAPPGVEGGQSALALEPVALFLVAN